MSVGVWTVLRDYYPNYFIKLKTMMQGRVLNTPIRIGLVWALMFSLYGVQFINSYQVSMVTCIL